QLRLQLVAARREVQQAERAAGIADGDRLNAGFEIRRRDGGARQQRLGFVGDRADDGGFLRKHGCREREEYSERDEQDTMRSHSTLLWLNRETRRLARKSSAEDRRDSLGDQGTNRAHVSRLLAYSTALDYIRSWPPRSTP